MSTSGTLFCAGALIVGVVLIAPDLDRVAPTQPVAERAEGPKPEPRAQVGNGFVSQELMRSPDGHFYANAVVNGAQVRFMIDTGASSVVLTREDAQRAGIALPDERALMMSAGGPVAAVPVTIDRVAVGALAATNVEGAVIEELGVSLLGQSFLERVGSVEIRGDRMVLR